MAFKFIERIKFKMQGRAVPVIRVTDVDKIGRVHTIHIAGLWKKLDNSVINTWDQKGNAIPPNYTTVAIINDKGVTENGYIVHNGFAAELYTRPVIEGAVNTEGIQGKLICADVLEQGMDLGKSAKNLIIGAIMGMAAYAVFIGPILGAMLK